MSAGVNVARFHIAVILYPGSYQVIYIASGQYSAVIRVSQWMHREREKKEAEGTAFLRRPRRHLRSFFFTHCLRRMATSDAVPRP